MFVDDIAMRGCLLQRESYVGMVLDFARLTPSATCENYGCVVEAQGCEDICTFIARNIAVMKGYTQSGQLNHEQYLLETALSALSDTWLPYIAKL
uniref:Uncharacterized protein n=1 Tax=Physcomitrium patens TaxID=3218 RepID=A0A2K1IXW4_PHYPA|nr:hypothetical protein PHYPA_023930 [Physcomitrium patens]